MEKDDTNFVSETFRELTAQAFLRDHVKPNKPVVIRRAVQDWRALDWSSEYLQQWGHEIVAVAPLQVSTRIW